LLVSVVTDMTRNGAVMLFVLVANIKLADLVPCDGWTPLDTTHLITSTL